MGAITAALFAVGFNAAELKEFMSADLKSVLMGAYYTFYKNFTTFYSYLFIENKDAVDFIEWGGSPLFIVRSL